MNEKWERLIERERAEARAEGRAEGRTEGRTETRNSMAEDLRALGISEETIQTALRRNQQRMQC